jgi:UDP-galactopyranose mutase
MIYNYFELRKPLEKNPFVPIINNRIKELEENRVKILNDMKLNGRVGLHRKYLDSIKVIEEAIEYNKKLLVDIKE